MMFFYLESILNYITNIILIMNKIGLGLKCLVVLFCFAALSNYTYAQHTVKGSVYDGKANYPLAGATIVYKGTNVADIANDKGMFEINVPRSTGLLVISFIGYRTQEIVIDGRNDIGTIYMKEDVGHLEEIVVAGVASGTSTAKLGFSVGKVRGEQIQEVPALDPANALRAKVSGVRVVQPSGNPLTGAKIRLRSSTSINTSNEPLVVVDGIITLSSVSDFNTEDIESIEVLKGASASSLYGSLAGNGVIYIRTKRGGHANRRPEITFRSEYGLSSVNGSYPVANVHPYALDENGEFVLSSGNRTLDSDNLFDNPFPSPSYNNVDAVFTSQPTYRAFMSLAHAQGGTNYYLSLQYDNVGGVLEPVDAYERINLRANIDGKLTNKFRYQFSSNLIRSKGDETPEQGQGANYFYSVLVAEPFINLAEKGSDGEFLARPTGYDTQASNWQNPLYVAQARSLTQDSDRFLGSLSLIYEPIEGLQFKASQSIDHDRLEDRYFYPLGYQTPAVSDLNQGEYEINNERDEYLTTDISLTFTRSFDKINLTAVAKYLYESRELLITSAEGSDFVVGGVRTLQTGSDQDIFSFDLETRSEGIFLDLSVDYDDKYIFGGLIRRDGSSEFGRDERYKVYGRGFFAYRLTEDFDIEPFDELKFRISYGTSGIRPGYSYQYETLQVSESGLTPGVLGNRNLKPALVREIEFGLNAVVASKYELEVNYAISNTFDDYDLVSLPGPAGFVSQWQNVADIEGWAFEVALSGPIFSKRDFSWDFSLTFDKVGQTYGKIDTPPYTRSIANTALNLFRVEEGMPYGTIYGNQIVTDYSQLTLDDNGDVVNDPNYGEGSSNNKKPSDYSQNEDGYLVLTTASANASANTMGTEDEQALYIVNDNGIKTSQRIGDTNPDFNVGFTSTMKWKQFGLYVVVDWQQGGDVYNYTKQLLYFNDRHQDQADYAKLGKHNQYSNGASQIYNGASASSHFVEDGGFVKVREISLSYTLDQQVMSSLGLGISNVLRKVKFGVTGRNLFTFTNYSGWDPEVAINENATNFRLDEFSYPNFRTFTFSLELGF